MWPFRRKRQVTGGPLAGGRPVHDRVAYDERMTEAIGEHITRHVGPCEEVFHELVSDLVHIDVHIVRPSAEREYFTLVTSGMSSRPMNVPPGREGCEYSELVLCLPSDWHVLEGDYEKEQYWWPFRLLKFLARLPHEEGCWAWAGTTVPNGDPPEPYDASVGYCCALIAAPILFGDDFLTLTLDGRAVHFHSVLPLYREEMDAKLAGGLDALLDLWDEKAPEICELVNPERRNAGL